MTPLPLDVARDVASILLATGRTVPAGPWVESHVRRARDERADSLPHNQMFR